MSKKILRVMTISVLLLSTYLPACDRLAPGIGENDEAAIYAAVARQLYTVDHTFGDHPPNWPIVYLLRATDDRAGDWRATPKSRQLSESVQKDIVATLDDLPAEFVWIDDRSEVIDESIMAVKGGGALVTLGNTYLQKDGSVEVPASIYFASLGAGGTTYVVKQVGGVWQITGRTGVSWMS